MKKLMIFTALMFLTSFASADTITLTNGKVIEGQKVSGDIRKEYYPDGQVQYERTYKNGVRHGLAKLFYENGNIDQEVMYDNGKKQGVLKQYTPDGKLEQIFTYKDDVIQGLVQKYHENGKLAHESNWENGEPDNKGMKRFEYYDNGNLKYEYSFYLGDGYRKEYYENGQISLESKIKGGQLLDCKNYDKEGNFISEVCPE